MKRVVNLRLAIAVFLLTLLPTLANALTAGQVFDKVQDSIVVVQTLDSNGEVIGQGSGVLLPSGKIATNRHVVEGGASYKVGVGGKFVTATLYAEDGDKDICLLSIIIASIDELVEGFFLLDKNPVELGKASSLKVGDRVYAVGAPRGLELSLSDGLVSQLRGGPPPLIQTTAAISPGSSGGGLFDSEGRLVGLTTLYVKDGQNLNFVMPVEWIAEVKPGKSAAPSPTPQKGRLYVEAEPTDARIRIMNIVPVFFQGIELSPGSYHVEVSSAGYETKNVWTKLGPGEDKRLTIRLERSKVPVLAEDRGLSEWGYRADALLRKGDWQGLLDWCQKWTKSEPGDPNAWSKLGLAYDMLKRYHDAIDALRQAVHIEPEDGEAWHRLGVVYDELNRNEDASRAYNQAIKAYRETVRIYPENAWDWFMLGRTYHNLNRYHEAIDAYRQVVRIKPENAWFWYRLGSAYFDLDRYHEAIDAYRQAIRIDPEFAMAWYNLGRAYGNLDRYNEAIDAYRQAIRINPEYADAWNNLAIAYALSDNRGAALEAVKELRRFDPVRADKLFDIIVPR